MLIAHRRPRWMVATTSRAFAAFSLAGVLLAGAAPIGSAQAAVANGKVIVDAVAASQHIGKVRLICRWVCREFKQFKYGPHCVKYGQDCSSTPELRLRPPPAKKTPG